MVAAMAGYAMYQICPAAGPRYVFPFPHGEPAYAAGVPSYAPSAPINAIPSLHFTWVLLVFLELHRVNRWLGVSAAIFMVLTAIAILGVGEHYMFDLLAALPFTLGLYAGLARQYGKAAVGAVATIGWQIYVRVLPGTPHFAVAATVITLAMSVFLLVEFHGSRGFFRCVLASKLRPQPHSA